MMLTLTVQISELATDRLEWHLYMLYYSSNTRERLNDTTDHHYASTIHFCCMTYICLPNYADVNRYKLTCVLYNMKGYLLFSSQLCSISETCRLHISSWCWGLYHRCPLYGRCASSCSAQFVWRSPYMTHMSSHRSDTPLQCLHISDTGQSHWHQALLTAHGLYSPLTWR